MLCNNAIKEKLLYEALATEKKSGSRTSYEQQIKMEREEKISNWSKN